MSNLSLNRKGKKSSSSNNREVIPSTPVTSPDMERSCFSKTVHELSVMKSMFRCVLCDRYLKGLHSVGNCEHKYCETCLAKVMKNKLCFICDAKAVPSDVKFDSAFNNLAFKFSKIAESIEAEIQKFNDTIYDTPPK